MKLDHYANFNYKDHLIDFIKAILKDDNIRYHEKINYLNRIFDLNNVKYVNLKGLLEVFNENVEKDKSGFIINKLNVQNITGKIKFINITDETHAFFGHTIYILSEDEKNEILRQNRDAKRKSLKKDTPANILNEY